MPPDTPIDEYLPISMLNQLEYCERRFFLMHVYGEMEINAHVLEGTFRHQQAHTPQAQTAGPKTIHRKVYVWSEALGVSGFSDVIEEQKDLIIPIEYKKGKMGRWLNDHIQLCAQAICLEERLDRSVESGYIFYFGSRRREEVNFNTALREQTANSAERARTLVARNRIPPPLIQSAKCRDCSLEPVCLPRETILLTEYTS